MRTIVRRAVYNAHRRSTYLMERRIHETVSETDDEESQSQKGKVKKAKDKKNQLD